MVLLNVDMDKIICVGKNYLKHALELGDAVPEEAMYFLKPPSTAISVSKPNQVVELPPSGDIHHEVELVFRIAKKLDGYQITHYTIGLDLTLRDLQQKLKKNGHPWEKAKVFKNAAILGEWHEVENLGQLLEQPFAIKVNGVERQRGFGKDMRFGPIDTVQDLQHWFPLCDGDILFTGTPEGVAALNNGDIVEVSGPNIRYEFTVKR